MSYYYEKKTSTKAPIVYITDGADEVPIKSWEVEIAPTLTGKSAIECSKVDGEEYLYGSTIVQGGFNINNGNNYASTTRLRTDNYIPITSGSYTIENDQSYEYVVYVYDETNTFIDAESIKSWQTYGTSFSINGNRHIRIGWRKSDNSTITADEITGYHCYAVGSKTISTVNLGRTIYGGTAEVVNGTCEPFNLVSLNRSPDRAKIEYGVTINTQNENTLNITSQGVAYACERLFYSLKSGTYAVKFQATSSDSFTPVISIYRTNGTGVKLNIQPNTLTTFTLADDADIDIRLFASGGGDTTVRTVEFTNFQIEKGTTAHDYSPYFEPFTFTPITPTPETALGVNNFWADEGDSQIVYYTQIESDDNYIIKESTLTSIANSIRAKTGNSAPIFVEDMADEILSIVTGVEPQVPISTSTLIADNSTLSETVTFTDDYHNYDILKIELARGDVATIIYATPEMLDTIAQYSNNSINFNELGTNIYVCYWKTSSTVWTRRNNRSVNLKYIYGLKFTNCTPVKTVFYSRQAINGPWVSFSPPEGKSFIKDYDYILFSTKTGNDDETQPCNNVFCPTLIEKTTSLFGDPFDNVYPIVLNVYNGTTKVIITDTTITSYNYFYVVGIKLIFE